MPTMFIRIQRWMLKLEVCRVVGFASTVVGLIYYALSSSFNHLFGQWNLLKIFLYSFFTVIICVAVLSVKTWQQSRSHRFKAHMAFLVLTITSVYSFFFDKAFNGKPDAYSLISCAAFAMMSLTLSRQSHCGFEVDLLYFFLGALIVLFMKIKLLLVIIGVGFSYSLIVLRTVFIGTTENGYLSLQDEHHVVIQVDSHQPNSYAVIVPGFMPAIEELRQANQAVVKKLWQRLCEYYSVLNNGQIPEALVNDHNLFEDLLPSKAVKNLGENVKLMMAGGFEKECLDNYTIWRREFLNMCSSTDRLDKYVTGGPYQRSVMKWIITSKIALRILLPNERRLFDVIFLGFSSLADLFFMDVCKEVTSDLLIRANYLTNRGRLLYHLPGILRLFGTLHDLIPEFEGLLSDQCSESLRMKATMTSNRLLVAIKDIFVKLENLILHDTRKGGEPKILGGICPITLQVMKYLSAFQVQEGKFNLLSKEIIRIIELLESNLEAKSKNYKNPALAYVFLSNNLQYILSGALKYKFETILRADWFQQQNGKIVEHLRCYRRSSWNEVLGFLKADKNKSGEPNAEDAESMKEKLNLFNMHFREIWKVQRVWFGTNEIRNLIIRRFLVHKLLRAYGMFIGRFYEVLGNDADEYIWYSIFDIEDLINDLFKGRRKQESKKLIQKGEATTTTCVNT